MSQVMNVLTFEIDDSAEERRYKIVASPTMTETEWHDFAAHLAKMSFEDAIPRTSTRYQIFNYTDLRK